MAPAAIPTECGSSGSTQVARQRRPRRDGRRGRERPAPMRALEERAAEEQLGGQHVGAEVVRPPAGELEKRPGAHAIPERERGVHEQMGAEQEAEDGRRRRELRPAATRPRRARTVAASPARPAPRHRRARPPGAGVRRPPRRRGPAPPRRAPSDPGARRSSSTPARCRAAHRARRRARPRARTASGSASTASAQAATSVASAGTGVPWKRPPGWRGSGTSSARMTLRPPRDRARCPARPRRRRDRGCAPPRRPGTRARVAAGSAARYGRSEVSASKTSATATMRAPRGMARPASPSGYPLPSQRSWWWRMARPLPAKKSNGATICAPMSGWLRMSSHSTLVERAALAEHRFRHADLADVVQSARPA